MIEFWIATNNTGKLNEFKMLLNREPLLIKSQGELPVFAAPVENGDSFLANARIKARAVRAIQDKHFVIGEDSGLKVNGLGGLPGIHSARYAGPKASDLENVAKLLKMMTLKPMSDRKAEFVCSIVLYIPTGEELIFEGKLTGEISKTPKGKEGFGYDTVFIPDGQTQTLAELGLAFKNRVSHRATAVGQMVTALKERNLLG